MKLKVARIIHWTFFILVIVYLITGFGVTQYRIIEPLTFGLLSKNLSFQLHENLWPLFLMFLILHMLFSLKIIKTKF